MSNKLSQLSSDYAKLCEDIRDTTSLPEFVTIGLLSSEKLKTVYKVAKATDILKFYSSNEAIIIFNEEILNVLSEDQQKYYIEEAIAHIGYDSEKDTIIISKPDIEPTFSGLLKKYGVDNYLKMNEVVKLYHQQLKDAEETRKAEKAAKKKEKF